MLKESYIWCDLETTGLDRKTDVIMEVGILVKGVEYSTPIYNPPQDLRMDDYVRKMHGRTGLTAKCDVMGISIARADVAVMQRLMDAGIKPGTGILAGSSIHFDRGFIDEYMPGFSRMLSHRMVDVSSFKLVLKDLRPDLYDQLFKNSPYPEHSVMADIRQSMADLETCLTGLAGPDPAPAQSKSKSKFKVGDKVRLKAFPEGPYYRVFAPSTEAPSRIDLVMEGSESPNYETWDWEKNLELVPKETP